MSSGFRAFGGDEARAGAAGVAAALLLGAGEADMVG
jgi:hypothetical protein